MPIALSITDLCKRTSFGRTTVYHLIKTRKLRSHKANGRRFFLLEELLEDLRRLPADGQPTEQANNKAVPANSIKQQGSES